MERLEQRRLLAVDFFGWQNVLLPADVNNDGVVAPADALLVVHELRQSGAHRLEPPAISEAPAPSEPPAASEEPVLSSTASIAEGERPGHVYIDVNGDNFLSAVDAFLVVSALRPEGQIDSVQFRLETTDLAGTPISAVDQGNPFVLNVFVQDVRPETVADRGVFQAYLDVTFDDALVTALGPFSFGASYQEETAGSLAPPGLLDEVGGTQTGFGLPPLDGPLGGGEFLVFSVPFEATTPGTVTFASDPAEELPFHDVTLFEPTVTVPTDDIVFGTTELTVNIGPVVAFPDAFTVDEDSGDNFFDVLTNDQINTAGTLTVTGIGAPDQGGTVVNNGDHLLYTPAGNFAGTETFTYTIGDGLDNFNQETVTVSVIGINDPPVAGDDGGARYTTDEDTPLTTGNVLDNDTDLEGDPLGVSGFDTTGTQGLVTSNGDGTFTYDPNGQFDQLGFGQQATDSFTYTVTDGNDGVDTATVTLTITAAPPATGDIAGFVYADVDNDGARDGTERAIGDVEVRLAGTDIFGRPVALSTRTDAQGRYGFPGVLPGSYEVIEIQPRFFLDGVDTVNGVVHAGPNDRVAITSGIESARIEVSFGERSLHPDFISVADAINTALRQGIVVGFDNQWNQLWYSVLDGWDGVTSVGATVSAGGSTANLSVSNGQAADLAFAVPTSPLDGWFRVRGQNSGGRVVQFIGTMAQFTQAASGLIAEGEAELNGELVDAVFAELG